MCLRLKHHIQNNARHCFLAICLALAPLHIVPVHGQEIPQDNPIDRAAAQVELQAVRKSISLSSDRLEKMRAEIAAMDGDRAQQNAALIDAAQRVKLAEENVAAVELRFADLIAAEEELRDGLDGTDRDIANLLAGLQRITKSPPPPILISPTDAIGSARGALLLSAILPQLQGKAGSVSVNLTELLDLREKLEAEKTILAANLANLFQEQLRTATLIEARKRGAARVADEIAAEEQLAEDLANRAKSLSTLVAELAQNIQSVSSAADAADTAAIDPNWVNLDAAAIRTALANTERKEPAVPFPAARGYLAMPASGVIINRFGSDDGFGSTAKGIAMVTRAEAQVIAPADGWVMYKGPYLNYGQIIILNPGQGYSILLAGLDTTSVELGQFVMLGEPIGQMGSRTIGQALTTNAGVSRPTLYIELREQDTPLNPTNWWADTDNLTQSG